MLTQGTRVLILAALSLACGCSFKPAEPGGLKVALRASDSLLLHALTNMSTVLETPVNGLDDLNCFAVNVRGGTIDTDTICSGLQIGIMDGAYQGIDTEFTPIVPVADGLTFEALGFKSSGCDTLDGEGDSGFTIYKIGQTLANVGESSNRVTIPVSFSTSNTFSCTGGAFTVFSDDFSYGSGTLGSTVGTNAWTFAGVGLTVSSSNNLQGTTSINEISFVNSTIDVSKTFTGFQITADVSTTNSGSVVLVGLTTDVSASPSGLIGCMVNYSGTTSATITAGNRSGAVDVLPGGTASGTIANPHVFTCDINKSGSGFTVKGTIVSGAGTLTTGAVSVSNPCGSTGCEHAVLRNNESAGPSTGPIYDDFFIRQASTAQ